MLILERSVTKLYWEPVYKQLARSRQLVLLKNTGVHVLRASSCKVMYTITANDKPVAWLYLWRRPNWKCWEVMQAFVFPELRGHGLALRLYQAAIDADGVILASGETQSRSSRVLWQRFIENRTFNIWAHDFNSLDSTAGVEYHEGELFCSLPVYERVKSARDIRLIATRNT